MKAGVLQGAGKQSKLPCLLMIKKIILHAFAEFPHAQPEVKIK